MSRNELQCLRCRNEMFLLKREKIQLGEATPWTGQLHNFTAGALDVEIHVCPNCGKLEFFTPSGTLQAMRSAEGSAKKREIVARKCMNCGRILPQEVSCCPVCGKTDEPPLPQIKCPTCGTVHDFDDPRCPYCDQPVE